MDYDSKRSLICKQRRGNKNTCFLFVLFIQTTIVFPGWAALGLSAKACGKGRHWQAQTLAIFQYHGLHLDNNDWDVTFTDLIMAQKLGCQWVSMDPPN